MKAPADRIAAWCESALRQQEGLAACLDWLQAPNVELKVAFPRMHDGEVADLSFDDSLVVGLLRQRSDAFLAEMRELKMVAPTESLRLRPGGDVVRATYAVVDAWRDTRLAARWLIRAHGTAEQQACVTVARGRHPEHATKRPIDGDTSVAASVLGRLAGMLRSPATKPCVLIVDDDADAREAFELFIMAKFPNLRVITTRSGAASTQPLLDPGLVMVLSDLNMPDQDGIHFLTQARDLHPGIQCYLMTGYSGTAITAKANAAGLDGVFQKPVDMAQLNEILRRAERGLVHVENQG